MSSAGPGRFESLVSVSSAGLARFDEPRVGELRGEWPVECSIVIDRDEVLHVARLARLALHEDELEPMARELSAVLDHVAKIGELDLNDVPPSIHVVEVSGGLREDQPRASLPREVALAQAPAVGGEGFLVPSPQA
ncbi:MAG TPA: Asp-tRNA(Asn)/Glu-tRNA(Gln) amidotransferase subunit GatC [Solirubrobacteraceae bacterium]